MKLYIKREKEWYTKSSKREYKKYQQVPKENKNTIKAKREKLLLDRD
jgi:hypothetical protein